MDIFSLKGSLDAFCDTAAVVGIGDSRSWILKFCFCSFRHHGVVLTMFALNKHVLSFDHHQTGEVAGQQ